MLFIRHSFYAHKLITRRKLRSFLHMKRLKKVPSVRKNIRFSSINFTKVQQAKIFYSSFGLYVKRSFSSSRFASFFDPFHFVYSGRKRRPSLFKKVVSTSVGALRNTNIKEVLVNSMLKHFRISHFLKPFLARRGVASVLFSNVFRLPLNKVVLSHSKTFNKFVSNSRYVHQSASSPVFSYLNSVMYNKYLIRGFSRLLHYYLIMSFSNLSLHRPLGSLVRVVDGATTIHSLISSKQLGFSFLHYKLTGWFLYYKSILSLFFRLLNSSLRKVKFVRRRSSKVHSILFHKFMSICNKRFSFLANSGALSSFILNLTTFMSFYRGKVTPILHYSLFPVIRKRSYFNTLPSLFSNYFKLSIGKHRSLLNRLRFLRKHTYTFYAKATGSNIYSTFIRNRKVLYSRWSGMFKFKKRLKYRKQASYKISNFFQRYISSLYRDDNSTVRRLNLVFKGFVKFLSFCLTAFKRQIEHDMGYNMYYLNNHVRELAPCRARPRRIKVLNLFSSFVSSSLASHISPSYVLLLNNNISVSDVSLINKIISSDNNSLVYSLYRSLRNKRYGSFIPKSLRVDPFKKERFSLIQRISLLLASLLKVPVIKLPFYISSFIKYKSVLLSNSKINTYSLTKVYILIRLLKLLSIRKRFLRSFSSVVNKSLYSFLYFLKRRLRLRFDNMSKCFRRRKRTYFNFRSFRKFHHLRKFVNIGLKRRGIPQWKKAFALRKGYNRRQFSKLLFDRYNPISFKQKSVVKKSKISSYKRRKRYIPPMSKRLLYLRTRMRKLCQLVLSIGYVKYKASLSHGGCVPRKRYYAKKYI